MISTGDHTNKDVCEALDISEGCFYRWKDEKSEFNDALKKAYQKRLESLIPLANKTLRKTMEGYEVTETSTRTYGRGVYKQTEVTITTKYVQPNLTAAIFSLKARDRENFKEIVDNNIVDALGVVKIGGKNKVDIDDE